MKYFYYLLLAFGLTACADGTNVSAPTTVIGTTDIACADNTGKEVVCK